MASADAYGACRPVIEGHLVPDKPSIAVLPFNNMSGDPEQEYFSDGITEDIITGLSPNKNFLVIARNSTFTYKGMPYTPSVQYDSDYVFLSLSFSRSSRFCKRRRILSSVTST